MKPLITLTSIIELGWTELETRSLLGCAKRKLKSCKWRKPDLDECDLRFIAIGHFKVT